MQTKLIYSSQFQTGMIITGIELANGDVAGTGKHRLDSFEEEWAICTYLHNGNTTKFLPVADSRYRVEVPA